MKIFLYVMGLLLTLSGICGVIFSIFPWTVQELGTDLIGYRLFNLGLMKLGAVLLIIVMIMEIKEVRKRK